MGYKWQIADVGNAEYGDSHNPLVLYRSMVADASHLVVVLIGYPVVAFCDVPVPGCGRTTWPHGFSLFNVVHRPMYDGCDVRASLFLVEDHVSVIVKGGVSYLFSLQVGDDVASLRVFYEDKVSDVHVWLHAAGFHRHHGVVGAKGELGCRGEDYEHCCHEDEVSEQSSPITITIYKFFYYIFHCKNPSRYMDNRLCRI